MAKRNTDFLLSLQTIPAPEFSDGDPSRHPHQTVPQRNGLMNYYRPCYPEEQRTLLWLSKLGTALYKNAVHSLPSDSSAPALHAPPLTTPSTSASHDASSITSLVLAPQTRTPHTSLPIAPEIGIRSHGEVTCRLVSFPAGYKLFVHTLEVGTGQKYNETIQKGSTGDRKKNVRHDAYLFGHPSGAKFRSPNEFLPHLWWMVNDPQHTECQCVYCGSILPRRQFAIETTKPEEASKKQAVHRGSIFGAAEVAALVKGAPIFRIGEIVWAKSKTTFVKVPEGAPTGSFLPNVPLWPAVIHKINHNNPTKYDVFLLKLRRENNALRSISVLEERLLPWLAHSPVEPTSAELLTASHLGVPELALHREAIRQAHEIQQQYRPFGGYHEPPMSEEELKLYTDLATREWMEKQHNFERYTGMWFGTERILCQEVVRMVVSGGPEVPQRDVNDNESQYDFFYIRSIFNDPDDGLTMAGDIYRRRQPNVSESTKDGFDGEYVWYQASQKMEEYTVDICNVAGRYYHQQPNLHSQMEVKLLAPETDRSVALQLGRPLSYAGPEKEGGTYIKKVLGTSRPTSARQGNNRLETWPRTHASSTNPRKRQKPVQIQEEPIYTYSLRKRSKLDKTLLDSAKSNSLRTSIQSDDETSHGGFDTIPENSYGNDIEETIISPAVEREHTTNSSGNGQGRRGYQATEPSNQMFHRQKGIHTQTELHNSDTDIAQALHKEQQFGMSLLLEQKTQSVLPKPIAGLQRNLSIGERPHDGQTTGRGSPSKKSSVEPHPTRSSSSHHKWQHPTDAPCFDNVKSDSDNIMLEEKLEQTSTPPQTAISPDHNYPPSLPSTPARPKSTASSNSSKRPKKTIAVRGDQKGKKPSGKRVTPKERPLRPDSSRTTAVLKWRGKLRMDNLDACDAIGLPLEKAATGKLVVSDQQGSQFHASLLARLPEMLEISKRVPGDHAERYFSQLDQVLSSRNCMCLVLTASRLASDWDKTRVVFDELVQSMKSGGYCGVVKHDGLRMLIKPQDDMLLCLAQFGTDATGDSQTATTDSTTTDATSDGRGLFDATAESAPPGSEWRLNGGSFTQRESCTQNVPPGTASSAASSNPVGSPIITPLTAPETPATQFAQDAFVRSDRFRNSPVIACLNYADQVSGTVDLSEITSLSLLVHAIGLALGYGNAWCDKKPSDVKLRFMGFDRSMWTVVEENSVPAARQFGGENVTGDLGVVKKFAMSLSTTHAA